MIITGKITDAKTGELLEFANVYVSDAGGKLAGGMAVANVACSYTLLANPGQYITASMVGYAKQTQQVGTGTVMNYGMKEDVGVSLDEAVVEVKKAFPMLQVVWGVLALAGLGYIIYEYKTTH